MSPPPQRLGFPQTKPAPGSDPVGGKKSTLNEFYIYCPFEAHVSGEKNGPLLMERDFRRGPDGRPVRKLPRSDRFHFARKRK